MSMRYFIAVCKHEIEYIGEQIFANKFADIFMNQGIESLNPFSYTTSYDDDSYPQT